MIYAVFDACLLTSWINYIVFIIYYISYGYCVVRTCCDRLHILRCIQGGQKLTPFLYTSLSSINRYSKLGLFYIIRRKFVITLSINIPPHLKYVATLPCKISFGRSNCRTVSLITPLVSGVASLSVLSSIINADTMNIWRKNCRMWQLLYTINETINTLFHVVYFLKICCYRSYFVFNCCF